MFLAISFCSTGLKQFGKIQNHNVWLQKHWLGNFAWKVIFWTAKVRDELLEMGKNLKIKHSVSSASHKLWGNLFVKKFFKRKQRQMYRGMFYMGTNDYIMQREKLMVKRFQIPSQVNFSSQWPWTGLSIYYLKILRLNLKNTFCTLCLWGWRFQVKSAF